MDLRISQINYCLALAISKAFDTLSNEKLTNLIFDPIREIMDTKG